jgi:hypothetical protein
MLLTRATLLRFRGRVHFPKDRIGEVEHDEAEDFVVFRKVVLDPAGNQPEKPGARFTVRFRFSRFGARTNRLLSRIPIPFIVAQPGFRSKTWMMGRKSGAFQGFYEWDSIEDAESYWTSFPMKLMKRRAVPQSLTHEIRRA